MRSTLLKGCQETMDVGVHSILSAGAGGSTKLVIPGTRHGKIERIFNFKNPYEYITRNGEILERKEQVKGLYEQFRQRLH